MLDNFEKEYALFESKREQGPDDYFSDEDIEAMEDEKESFYQEMYEKQCESYLWYS